MGIFFCRYKVLLQKEKKTIILQSSAHFRQEFVCLFFLFALRKQSLYYSTKPAIMKKMTGLFCFSLLLLSCNSYYKTLTVQNPSGTDCKQAIDMPNRYFVFHSDSAVFAMQDISLTNNSSTLKYKLAELPVEHMLHLNNSKTKKFKYTTGKGEYDRSAVVNEIHIYADSDTASTTGMNEIAVANLTRIEILEKDKPKTRRKRAIGWGVGAAVAVVGIGLILASSLKFNIQ
jgi:hypothetical protein